MSNRLFQGLVHQMRDTIDSTIGVVDETATIIACSDLTKVGTTNEFVSLDLNDSHDIFIRDGYTYKPFGVHVKPDYAVFIEGTDDQAAKYASILAISLSSMITLFLLKVLMRQQQNMQALWQLRWQILSSIMMKSMTEIIL